jgi:hypothetical protein
MVEAILAGEDGSGHDVEQLEQPLPMSWEEQPTRTQHIHA